MEIRMYECGFGDCFRLREANQVDLYVDFGIHSSSWSGNDKTNRFDNVIADMNEKKDFLCLSYRGCHRSAAAFLCRQLDFLSHAVCFDPTVLQRLQHLL